VAANIQKLMIDAQRSNVNRVSIDPQLLKETDR
jgi:hypothetical protein